MTLYPYRKNGVWVFDDKNTGLKEEAFVMGMSELISDVVSQKRIHQARKGFKLTFSNQSFNHDIELFWFQKGDFEYQVGKQTFTIKGNWYHTGDHFRKGVKIGWLCPALFKYFDEAPERLYAKVEPLPTGIDPIWHGGVKFAYVSSSVGGHAA